MDMGASCNDTEVYISHDDVKMEEKFKFIDIIDQFIDGEGIHKREQYIVKNEENNSNCLLAQLNANALLPDVKKMPQINDSDPELLNHECHTTHSPKRHINIVHSNIKKYSTNGKSFLESHVKNVHLKLNDKVKKYECQSCEYAGKANDVKRHIKSVHLRIRDHKCHLCEYAASTKTFLERHIKSVHLRIKDHKCHLCEYAASTKAFLERHIKSVHLRIKDHKCDLCEYAGNERADIKKHMKSVHLRIKDHKCHLCDYATGDKALLKSHIKSVHLRIKDLERHVKSVHLKIKD